MKKIHMLAPMISLGAFGTGLVSMTACTAANTFNLTKENKELVYTHSSQPFTGLVQKSVSLKKGTEYTVVANMNGFWDKREITDNYEAWFIVTNYIDSEHVEEQVNQQMIFATVYCNDKVLKMVPYEEWSEPYFGPNEYSFRTDRDEHDNIYSKVYITKGTIKTTDVITIKFKLTNSTSKPNHIVFCEANEGK